MSYDDKEIQIFEARWNDYIDDFNRLKLAAPVEEMDRIDAAQDELRAAVENSVESFKEE